MKIIYLILSALLIANPSFASVYVYEDWIGLLERGQKDELKKEYEVAAKSSYPVASIKFAEDLLYRNENLSAAALRYAKIFEFRRDALVYYSLIIQNNRKSDFARAARLEIRSILLKDGFDAEMVVALGGFRVEEDLGLLFDFAKSPNPNNYRSAIVSIRKTCFPGAQDELKKMALSVDSVKREFIGQTEGILFFCK